MRYNLYVDCMPGDGLQEINKDLLDRIVRVARCMDRLKQPRMDRYSSTISDEVRLEFTRTMGRILFDKTVTSQPGAFPFVTLPEPYQDKVGETGNGRGWRKGIMEDRYLSVPSHGSTSCGYKLYI